MATNCSSVTFSGTYKDSFYFDETQGDVDTDAFGISSNVSKYLIQCRESKFLLLNSEGRFDLSNLTTEQLHQPECIFAIHVYKDSVLRSRKGRPVMMYANKNGKKMVACCGDENKVYAEVMDLPQKIDGTAHKAVFYLTEVTGLANVYMFESTVFKNRFLGLETDGTVLKLVLRQKADEVDESCEFIMTKA